MQLIIDLSESEEKVLVRYAAMSGTTLTGLIHQAIAQLIEEEPEIEKSAEAIRRYNKSAQ